MKRLWVRLLIGGLLCLVLSLALRSGSDGPNKRPQPWKTGYWIWAGQPPATAKQKPDVLYVQVQGSRWPENLPEADEYVIVRRIEPATQLTSDLSSRLVREYIALQKAAGATQSRISGLQIDYDCATTKLRAYGEFLEQIRGDLPVGSRLSITALLDWFRSGTAIRETLVEVDEFVPQFYDIGSTRASSGIAEIIQPAKWASVFNSYQTPYRIGISSFGRIARTRADAHGRSTVRFFRDLQPIDFSGRRELSGSVSSTAAGEVVVRYEVLSTMPDLEDVQPGDVIDVTFPTEASVRAAYEAVRHFEGFCSGAIFFRWPNRSEVLTMNPDDVTNVLAGKSLSSNPVVEARNGFCAERYCSDLYLRTGWHFDPSPRLVEVGTAGSFDIFLPEGILKTATNHFNRIRVAVPAYTGAVSIYLGRAISTTPIPFEVILP